MISGGEPYAGLNVFLLLHRDPRMRCRGLEDQNKPEYAPNQTDQSGEIEHTFPTYEIDQETADWKRDSRSQRWRCKLGKVCDYCVVWFVN